MLLWLPLTQIPDQPLNGDIILIEEQMTPPSITAGEVTTITNQDPVSGITNGEIKYVN